MIRETNFSEIHKVVETNHPELWRVCYPRTYDHLGKWCSPKVPATLFAYSLLSASREVEADGFIGTATRNQMLVAKQCLEHSVPTFFVPTAVLHALENTNPPDDLRWTDLKMPHDGMVFMFEQGAVAHPADGPIAFVACAKVYTGIEAGFIMVSGAHQSDAFHIYDLAMSETHSPNFGSIARVSNIEYFPDRLHLYDMPLTASDKQWNEWATEICIKLILLMLARPEMVSKGQHVRSVKSKKVNTPPTQFWTPNIIGKTYQPQVVDGPPDGTSPSGGGDGGHRRIHWRRGHFAQQPYGPAHSLRKTIWREPVLVGEII